MLYQSEPDEEEYIFWTLFGIFKLGSFHREVQL
ncbi:Uncharacterised protein [Paenibacillus thiaminolyticus]|nr:Uncharacterised protein [Paenibacillus thiaminolyticus]